MSNYSYGAPPPPPPPPSAAGPAATPWYRKPGPLFLLGVVIAAAIAIPVLVVVLGGDDGGTAAGSSTTTAAATTTEATTTTAATTTTTAPTTTSATTTTSMPSPCGDPTLDALYQDCASGDMQACDDLFWQSPVGSACEEFGDTCGGTTSGSEVCADSGSSTTQDPAGSQLDYTLPAVFADNVDLAIGFTPDPTGWTMQAGGPIDADDLNEPRCHGYTTAAPSVEVNYSGGTSALLRFYFAADNPGDDTVLIVSDAYGNWACNDDYDFDAGILDPSVDILEAVEGTYDIWVASYNEGQTVPGTLYVTELPENHP